VINHAHLGGMIEDTLGDGAQFGAQIRYSPETEALETAGGIAQARHLLGEQPFLVVSGDIFCPHFNYEQVLKTLEDNDMWGNPWPPEQRDMAWIYLVKNPAYHPLGDFALQNFSIANQASPGESLWTYANIGVYRPEMFDGVEPGSRAQLGPLLRQYADRGLLGGEIYRGQWHNVGTVEQLAQLNAPLTH
jgi:MurNAc alpha-1-phosphate uridylyltransferase